MKEFTKFDSQYSQWITDISIRFKKSQIKAACKVNVELLRFYWSLGKDISNRIKTGAFGDKLIDKLSYDLCQELPEVKSFSRTNLYYMKAFYELYPNAEFAPQLEGQINCPPSWGTI